MEEEKTKKEKNNLLFLFLIIFVGLSVGLLIYSEYFKAQSEMTEMISSVMAIIKGGGREKMTENLEEILKNIDETEIENWESQLEEIDADLNSL